MSSVFPRARAVSVVTLVTLVLALITACGGDDTGTDDANRPFRLFAVLPLSSPLGQQAKMVEYGLRAGIEKVNANGGVGGRKIELTIADDRLDPTDAVSKLQEQLNGDTPPDAVWTGSTSNETLAMLPALSQAGVLSFSQGADLKINNPKSYPYHFGVQSASDQNYKAMLELFRSEGVKKLGFIAANDALGTYNLSAIKEILQGTGITLVSQSYDTAATDLTAPMDALRAENPDMLLMSGFGPAAGYLLDAREKLGWKVPVIGDLAMSGSNPGALVEPSAVEGVRIQNFAIGSASHQDQWLPTAKEMIEAVRAQGEITQIITLASLAYDTIMLLSVAAEQAGATDADSIKAALESLKTPNPVPWTTFGSFGYTADNHFPVTKPSDYIYSPATPLEGGQFQ